MTRIFVLLTFVLLFQARSAQAGSIEFACIGRLKAQPEDVNYSAFAYTDNHGIKFVRFHMSKASHGGGPGGTVADWTFFAERDGLNYRSPAVDKGSVGEFSLTRQENGDYFLVIAGGFGGSYEFPATECKF